MFTQPKQDINIWDLELCILHPGTQRVWGAKFELDITELNSKLRFQACCFSQVQDWRITVGRRLQHVLSHLYNTTELSTQWGSTPFEPT